VHTRPPEVTLSDAAAEVAPQRWRVMVVRAEPGAEDALRKAIPGAPAAPAPLGLPLVTRVTADAEAARHTADKLRALGAVVVILVEPVEASSAFCAWHSGRMAGRRCVRCGLPVCTACRDAAGGEEVCPPCWARHRGPKRRVRQRQLFVLFLFVVFLYEVWRGIEADRAATSPHGPVRVALYQFAPEGQRWSPLVRHLNDRGDPQPGAPLDRLRDIATWFNAERARYGGPEGYLHMELRAPQEGLPTLPPPYMDSDPIWMGPWRALQTSRALRAAVVARGEDPDAAAVRLYVIYGPQDGDLASHSRGSARGRIAVSYIDVAEQNPGYAALTVAHELAHTLGALDLYDDNSLSKHPEGFVEPWADPLYPQRWAELMAVDRPVGPGVELEPRSLDELRVGHQTAADLGWISDGEAKRFYSPASLGPLDRLPPRAPPAEPIPAEPIPAEPIPTEPVPSAP
jgi:hypothetical protein